MDNFRTEHAQEIVNTRVGNLGGSDAKMVLRAAELGSVDGLSVTDIRRLRVCFGVDMPESWGGNKYTAAGHDFEDTCAKMFALLSMPMEREKVLHADEHYDHFTAIAHADFVIENTRTVYECKCVAKRMTSAVINDYYAQLQWYYMLGAEDVRIIHGVSGDDIAPAIVSIERNEGIVEQLKQGLRIIDASYDAICARDTAIKIDATACSNEVQGLLSDYKELAAQVKDLEAKQAQIKGKLLVYMNQNGIVSISGDVSARYTAPAEVKTIDKKKLLAQFPDVATADVYTITSRNESVTITVKK